MPRSTKVVVRGVAQKRQVGDRGSPFGAELFGDGELVDSRAMFDVGFARRTVLDAALQHLIAACRKGHRRSAARIQ